MNEKERILLRIVRIRRLMDALEKRANEAAWLARPCCRKSTMERMNSLVARLHTYTDNLECDVLMFACQAD